MKKLSFILFSLSLMVGVASAQPYRSIFGQTLTAWNVIYQVNDYTETDSLVACGDTSINLWGYYVDYKILRQPFPGAYNYEGFLREDTNTGRVWYYHPGIFEEFLLMDLSLNIGDSFAVWNDYGNDSAVVDSIYYLGGKKQIVLQCPYPLSPVFGVEKLKFMEGIGPNAGVLFQIDYGFNSWSTGTYLLCAFKDNVQVYTNSSSYFNGQCRFEAGSVDEFQSNDGSLKLFPNPSTDAIRIEYYGGMPYSIEVLNYSGQCVSSKTDIASSISDLDVSAYPKGVYLLKVKGNDGSYATGKVIKL